MSQGIVEVPAWFRTVRFVQIGLAVLIVILNAVGLALFSGYGGIGWGLFTSIATVLICTYYLLATSSKPEYYNHLAILIMEVFMELWWLSAFSVTAWVASAFSVFDNPIYGETIAGNWKGAYIAFAISAAVSAVQWVLITTTLITFIRGVVHGNRRGQAQAQVYPTYVTPVKMEDGMGHGGHGGQIPVYPQTGQYA